MPYKTALITGGSRGIGAEIVRAFASAGWQTAFCCRNDTESARALANQTNARMFLCDVGNEEQAQGMVSDALAHLRQIDALVLNAGIAHYGLLTDMTCAQWDDVFAVNVRGAFLCARAALPGMLARGKGAITAVSSMWGQTGASCEVAYSSSKAALIGFVRALAKEVAPAVRVNCVAPGVIQTDMLAGFQADDLRALREQTPLARLGTPGDVARAVEFLSSDGASFITGQVLGVNGGFVI